VCSFQLKMENLFHVLPLALAETDHLRYQPFQQEANRLLTEQWEQDASEVLRWLPWPKANYSLPCQGCAWEFLQRIQAIYYHQGTFDKSRSSSSRIFNPNLILHNMRGSHPKLLGSLLTPKQPAMMLCFLVAFGTLLKL